MMWADLQEAFVLLYGPFIQDILLPVFVAAGIVLAIVFPLSRFWEPTEKINLRVK